MTAEPHPSLTEQMHTNAPKSWEMEVFQNVWILNKKVQFSIKSLNR